MNLTDTRVSELRLGADQPDGKVFFDDKISGFGVRIYRSGRKVWLYQFRLGKGGRTYKFEIGSTATHTAEQARQAARIADGQVAKGENPIELRRQNLEKHKNEFGELIVDYLAEKQKPTKPGKKPLRPRSYAEVKRHLEDHCKTFKHRPIKSITQADVARLHKAIAAKSGIGAASHVWSTLRAFLHWTMRQGHVERNVAALFDGGGVNPPRERVLADSELRAVWLACRSDHFGSIVKLLILTGARRDEVGHMRKAEITLEDTQWVKPHWTVPADRAKNHNEYIAPLSTLSVKILQPIADVRDDYVFGHGKTRGFSGWSKAKAALDNRIAEAGDELEPWTLHDLRRTFSTGFQKLGIPPHIADAAINHLPPKLQRTYQRHAYVDEIAAAMEKWSERVAAIVSGESNVVQLQKTEAAQ